MEFDWLDAPFRSEEDHAQGDRGVVSKTLSAIRLLPEGIEDDEKARYFNLGKSINDRGIFTVFWTDGKRYRAIFSREMTPEELSFYDRKNSELGY